ncbi:hypothetical protein IKE67_10350 [bacterium]|nr:hypothetical protein [bacterium]
MVATNIRLRRGKKSELPTSAPSGTPLWCEDTKELYVGTDNGIAKVGVNDLSSSTDNTNVLNPVGINSGNTTELKRNTSVSIQGNKITAGTFQGALSGNASTATKLQTARTIALTGDVTASGTFDGSGNLSLATKVSGDFNPLFTSYTYDRTLSASESTGLMLQGSLVTNTYSDAVTQITNEYNNGTAKTLQIEEQWVQPVLGANGTLGGSTFAVAASSEYSTSYQACNAFKTDFDDSVWLSAAQTNKQWYLTFYNPTAIKVSKIDLTIHSTSYIPSGGKLQGSNNGTSWTDVCSFTNTTATNQADKFVIDARSNATFYKYYRILFTGSNNASYVSIGEVVIWATYLVNSLPYRLASNGHKIALVAHKSIVDDLYNRTGCADFYVLDTTNKQFYLPKELGAPLTRHIVKSFRYGSEWYDLYNDGWCIQGGEHYQYTNSSAKTGYNYIQLHRAMRELEYSINVQGYDNAYNGTIISTWAKTTTGFYTYTNNSYQRVMWQAMGRTAVPKLSEYDADILANLQARKKYYKVGSVLTNVSNINVANVLSDISTLQTQMANKAEKSELPQSSLFTHFYESGQYEFTTESFITINHNLNLTADQIKKAIVIPCLICTKAVAGYALGQIFQMPTTEGYSGQYSIPTPFVLAAKKFTQRTGYNYAFWFHRSDSSYSYHYLSAGDVTGCFKYFIRIWY